MPITFIPDGNILDTSLQTVVCPVNCVGVMGKGLALSMAKHYKGLLYNYRLACTTGDIAIVNNHPTLWVYKGKQQVLCFPTKDHYQNASQLCWIANGMDVLVKDYKTLNIKSIGIPMLGCGCGGLSWTEVCQTIVPKLEKLPIEIVIFGPDACVNGKKKQ